MDCSLVWRTFIRLSGFIFIFPETGVKFHRLYPGNNVVETENYYLDYRALRLFVCGKLFNSLAVHDQLISPSLSFTLDLCLLYNFSHVLDNNIGKHLFLLCYLLIIIVWILALKNCVSGFNRKICATNSVGAAWSFRSFLWWTQGVVLDVFEIAMNCADEVLQKI